MKIVKRREKTIKIVVGVYNGTFKFLSLFRSQIFQR